MYTQLFLTISAKVPNPEKLKSDVLQRFKRQDLDEDALEKQLCSDKGAGEWFRLETGKDKCRDVIQCTSSVSFEHFTLFLFKNIPFYEFCKLLCHIIWVESSMLLKYFVKIHSKINVTF